MEIQLQQPPIHGHDTGDIIGLETPAEAPPSQLQQVKVEEIMGIPNGVVGYIIGRGGESITSMQRRTGCRVQIQKEHEMTPGSSTRMITLTSSDRSSIAACRDIIDCMVAERHKLNAMQNQGASSAAIGADKLQQALSLGHQLVTVEVPDADVGLVIGKSGINIRSVQDRTGAHIQIPQSHDEDNPSIRTCSITHPNIGGANMAKAFVEDILRNKFGRNDNEVSLEVVIPDKDVGMIIGRSGCVIREIQSKTRTRIQIPSDSPTGEHNRIAVVTGSADGCNQAKQMMDQIVSEQSSQSVMTSRATNTASSSQYGYDGSFQYAAAAGGGLMQQQQRQHGRYQHNYYVDSQQQQLPYGIYGQQQHAITYGQYYSAAYGGLETSGLQQQQQSQPKMVYSSEWTQYYAAQAAAAAVQQRQQQEGETVHASITSADIASQPQEEQSGQQHQITNTAATAYYDDFWRYAACYGEEAARRYYGSWSPPPVTAAGSSAPPNNNPSGISAANYV